MCYGGYNEHHYQYSGNTNVHTDRSPVYTHHASYMPSSVELWLCRNMESGNDQYSNSWNNNLYIYTNRSMCNRAYDEHHYQHTGNTNVHTDRTTLSKQYSACTSCDIR